MGYYSDLDAEFKANKQKLTYKDITKIELRKLKDWEKEQKKKLEKYKKDLDKYNEKMNDLIMKVNKKKKTIFDKEQDALNKAIIESKKNEDEMIYIKPDRKQKKDLANTLKNKVNLFLGYQLNNFEDIRTQLCKDITVKNYKEAEEIIRTLDISIVFGIKDKYIKCPVIPNHTGSVGSDKDGHYRYFSKSKSEKQTYVFDLIDLTEIIYNANYYIAIRKVCELINIRVEEGGWDNIQRLKYADNIDILENEDEIEMVFPELYGYIKKYIYLLKEMNSLAIENIRTQKEAVEGESVFFTSARYLEEYFEGQGIKKDHTTISRLINMFCVLGLINKVQNKKVPKLLLKKAKERMEKLGRNFDVNFYTIPLMAKQLLEEAEKRVIKLKKAGIAPSKIISTAKKEKNIKTVLGVRIFNSVFGDNAELIKIFVEKRKESKKSPTSNTANNNPQTLNDGLFDEDNNECLNPVTTVTDEQFDDGEYDDLQF